MRPAVPPEMPSPNSPQGHLDGKEMALILRPSSVLIVWVNRIPGLCLCSAGNPTRGHRGLSHRAIVNLDVLDNFQARCGVEGHLRQVEEASK
jgi:hypothetical protein